MGLQNSLGLGLALALTGTAASLIIVRARRARLAVLGVQYLCEAGLAALTLPLGVAMAILAVGLVASAILAVSVWGVEQDGMANHGPGRQPSALSWVAAGLVGVAGLALGSRGWGAIPGVAVSVTIGSTGLLGLGLLQVGLGDSPLRVSMGLLTALSGFQLAYSEIEPSLAVTALLGAVHIGIALVGSYMLRGLAVSGEG